MLKKLRNLVLALGLVLHMVSPLVAYAGESDWEWIVTQPAQPGVPAVPGSPAVPAVPDTPAVYETLPGQWMISLNWQIDGVWYNQRFATREDMQNFVNDPNTTATWANSSSTTVYVPGETVQVSPAIPGSPEIPAVPEIPAIPAVPEQGHFYCPFTGETSDTNTGWCADSETVVTPDIDLEIEEDAPDIEDIPDYVYIPEDEIDADYESIDLENPEDETDEDTSDDNQGGNDNEQGSSEDSESNESGDDNQSDESDLADNNDNETDGNQTTPPTLPQTGAATVSTALAGLALTGSGIIAAKLKNKK